MTFKSINPHSPSEVIGEYEESGERGVEEAVSRAHKAFPEWLEQTAVARGGALSNIADEIEHNH
jgi:acyl-CoA reductase-like NAD-dependent aldehyde dehydrogenase